MMYKVQIVRVLSGERMPLVVDGKGVPDAAVSEYVTTVLRRSALSVAAIEQNLRGVRELMNAFLLQGIAIHKRISDGSLLSASEILALRPALTGSGLTRQRGSETACIRIKAAIKYLGWLAARSRPGSLDPHAVSAMVDGLRQLRPRAAKPTWKRIGLSPEEFGRLEEDLEGMRMQAKAAPGTKGFVAYRRSLILDIMVELGLRIGEVLGLRLCDLDLTAQTVRIVRRPDARDDGRHSPALVKGEGRLLPLSPFITERMRVYIASFRGSPGHDFVFVSVRGAPLSRDIVSREFSRLGSRLGLDRFSPHVLRHTWNDQFSEDADQAGLSLQDTSEARRIAMGWTSASSARFYLRQRTHRQMRAISLARQKRLKKGT